MRPLSIPDGQYTPSGPARNSFHRLLLTLLALLTALTPCATAQRAAAHAGRPAFGRTAHRSGVRRSSPYTSLPFPFLGDSFNPDDIYSTGYPVASQPPAILLQAARAMSGSSDYPGQPDIFRLENEREPSSSTQPLMIELQNGRYVRVTNTTPANGVALTFEPKKPQPAKLTRRNSTHPAASNSTPQPPAIAAASPPDHLPAAVLVFRDGHTEEVRDYTIADGILYARGDFYTDGYWNKKIALSTLNVPQTLQANSTRNVKFVLPSSPNEVITRP
jgi:hypothetical protein